MEANCCCGPTRKPERPGRLEAGSRPSFVVDTRVVDGREVPLVSTRLSRGDRLGALLARLDIGRMRFAVPPGLYGVGRPGPESPVLVTANYKLSFDRLRRELAGVDAWVLVLDTRGINVWCAAGKGTFGTRELVERTGAVGLERVVSHRRLVLPQLGAPGVSAPEVARTSGWRVVWGPVRAADLPAFLAAGMRKTEAMRKVTFRLGERLAVAPVELRHALPFLAAALGLAALFALPASAGYPARLLAAALPGIGAVLAGTLAFPALLPLLPFRAFALKGASLGLAWGAAAAALTGAGPFGAPAVILTVTPLTAFLAMNFTGSSTFTCQTGAEQEVRRGLIPMAASLAVGLGLAVAARLLGA